MSKMTGSERDDVFALIGYRETSPRVICQASRACGRSAIRAPCLRRPQ